jgi:hypothetical protein
MNSSLNEVEKFRMTECRKQITIENSASKEKTGSIGYLTNPLLRPVLYPTFGDLLISRKNGIKGCLWLP